MTLDGEPADRLVDELHVGHGLVLAESPPPTPSEPRPRRQRAASARRPQPWLRTQGPRGGARRGESTSPNASGTFILICFGDGVVAMAVAALNQSGRGTAIFDASGDWLIIGWGWGFAVAFGVYVAGGVSGAHINPAVTLAFAARRGFPWRKVPGYIAAQLLGAFLGAALVYVVYKGAIDSYERANHITRGAANSVPTYSIFATFPAKYLGNLIGTFIDQVVGTAFLVAFVFAVVDAVNQPVRANLAPLVIGFIVVAIGLSFGANAGYAINPARDFGPRLFAWIAGWGRSPSPATTATSTRTYGYRSSGPSWAGWSAPSSTTSPSTTSSSPVARRRRPALRSADAPSKTRPKDMRGRNWCAALSGGTSSSHRRAARRPNGSRAAAVGSSSQPPDAMRSALAARAARASSSAGFPSRCLK